MARSDTVASTGESHAGPATPSHASPRADLLYDSVYSAAIGGSVIALFFLVVDSLAGRPLFTPSLIGTVLFTSTPADAVAEVRLDMVAYFSVVHFLAFAGLGATTSALCRRTGLIEGHTLMLTGVLFVVLTAAFLAGDFLLMPGVVSTIGLAWVLSANLLTGVAMAFFLRWAHASEGRP